MPKKDEPTYKKVRQVETKKYSPPVAVTKTIRNVSLQAWSIPTGQGSIRLSPGSSVVVDPTAINERVLNLRKRRLITIS